MPKGYPGSGKAKKRMYRAGRKSVKPEDISFSTDSRVAIMPLASVSLRDLPVLMAQGAIVIHNVKGE